MNSDDQFEQESRAFRADAVDVLDRIARQKGVKAVWDRNVAVLAPCGSVTLKDGSPVLVSAHASGVNFIVGEDGHLWSFDDEDAALRIKRASAAFAALAAGSYERLVDGSWKVSVTSREIVHLTFD